MRRSQLYGIWAVAVAASVTTASCGSTQTRSAGPSASVAPAASVTPASSLVAPAPSAAAPTVPPPVPLELDPPGIPIFTVEDLAAHSDLVILGSQSRVVDEVSLTVSRAAPSSRFTIIEMQIDEVLRGTNLAGSTTVTFWAPDEFVPHGALPGSHVIFLQRPPADFDPEALQHLVAHGDGNILVPGWTSIMDVHDATVTVRGDTFYGLHPTDAAGEPKVGSFSLDALRPVVADTPPARPAAPTPTDPPRSDADQTWISSLDASCAAAGPLASELYDLLTGSYTTGNLDGTKALQLFMATRVGEAALRVGLAGISADLSDRWATATADLDEAGAILERAAGQTGADLQASLVDFRQSIVHYEVVWSGLDVQHCKEFA